MKKRKIRKVEKKNLKKKIEKKKEKKKGKVIKKRGRITVDYCCNPQ